MPEGEEKEQEIGNLFENISMQVQGAQIVGNKMDAKRPTPRHIIIKMSKVKDKERILKAAREKKLFTYRGISMKLFAFFNEFFLIFHIFDILFSSS